MVGNAVGHLAAAWGLLITVAAVAGLLITGLGIHHDYALLTAWTVAKLALLGSLLTIMAFAISQLPTWFFAPFMTTQRLTDLTPTVFDTSGVSYAAWTLTAFCASGAFLGTLVRRTLAAMAVTLAVYVGVGALTRFYLRNHYPVSTYWPKQLFEAGWLLALSVALIAGTIWLVRRYAT